MHSHRTVWLILMGALALLAGAFIGPLGITTTQGNSMAPLFQTGDLAIVRAADNYQVGDIAVYRSDVLKQMVLHRIIREQNGRYSFKGDNNAWADPETPAAGHLVGKLALRIPQGGLWINRIGRPLGAGLVAFGLIGAAWSTTSSRLRRKGAAASRHARSSRHNPLWPLPSHLRPAASMAATAGAVAAVLGAFAWSAPVAAVTAQGQQDDRQMSFAYSAKVPKTAGYAGTTLSSPEPVFRKLAKSIDVHYIYKGDPGSIAVDAELSTAAGWRATVPLAARASFTGKQYAGRVRLDLAALERRAEVAARITGVPADHLIVAVVPKVTTATGESFNPRFPLTLAPLQVALVNGAVSTVKDPRVIKSATLTPQTLHLFGRQLPVATARKAILVLLGIALLGAGLIALIAATASRGGEAARIRRRYARWLVVVNPTPVRSNVDTFLVPDANAIHPYRIAVPPPAPAPERPDIDVRPHREHVGTARPA